MKTRRCLLVAMSGLRVRDQQLREVGMTLPGFVERGKVIASLPSLSLLTLAAHSPEHWELEYRELDELGNPEEWAALVAAQRFELIAISSFSARILEAYALADALRAAGQTVILGGLHVTALPEEAGAHADAVVEGEAERIWPELLGDFENGRLRPRYASRQAATFHLSESRVPRYDLLELSRYNRLTLQTTRGCPHDCVFCAASRTLSPYKLKPIEVIRRELEAIVERWPRPFIELADDNTFVSKQWSRELAGLLGEYDVRWFTETDLSVGDDEALLERLAKSGCAQLLIGLEAVSPQALRGIDGRGWKGVRAEKSLEAIQKIQSYGIAVNGCFVFGLDDDDGETFARTREFVEASGLCDVQITLLTPFPGTALHRKLSAEGRLLREVYWDQCTLFDLTFVPRCGADVLLEGFRKLMIDLYRPEATVRRRGRWRDLKRSTRDPEAEAG